MEFLAKARHWISLDTSPENGTFEAAKWIAQEAEANAMQAELQEEMYNGLAQANVRILPKNVKLAPGQEYFLLQSHIDTVNPGAASLWVENMMNPYNMIVKEGYLYGLGVADVKLDFLCKLEALKKFANHSNFKVPPLLLGTYGEEIGMHGMLRYIRRNKIAAKRALVGDSTNLRMVAATKGYATVEINIPFSEDESRYRANHDLTESTTTQTRIFKCKEHLANPLSGESAIDKIFAYLLQIPEGVVLMDIDAGVNYNTIPQHGILEFDVVSGVRDPMTQKLKNLYYEILALKTDFLLYSDPDFSPATSTLTISMIKTSPDYVSLILFCRFPPVISETQYQTWLHKLNNISTKVSGQVRVTDYKRPYRTNNQSPFAKDCQMILESMQLTADCTTQANSNESSLLNRVGVECLIFGAGQREGNVHTPLEKVKLDDIFKSIDFYCRAIERFCL